MPFSDPRVYVHPDGVDYVAVDDEQVWWRWPAERHGWRSRRPCAETIVEQCAALPPDLAGLALLLSGAWADER